MLTKAANRVKEEAPINETAPLAGQRRPLTFPLTRRAVLIFSLGVTVIFSLLAWIVTVHFRNQPFSLLFTRGQQVATQIVLGFVLGVLIAFIVLLLLLKARFLASLRDFIRGILDQVRPTHFDLILVALLAGFGEELFFRATLQPTLGLWLTSLIFAVAHTGLGLLDPAKLAFALFVFLMSLLLGMLFEQSGLLAVIVMHAVYDLIFLIAVKRFLRAADAQPVRVSEIRMPPP